MVLTVWTMLPFQNIINYVKYISGWQATALALHSSTPSPEQTQQTADGMHFISFLSEISVLYVLSVVCTQNQFLTTTSPLQNHRENREVKRIPQVLLYTGNREWQTLLWHEMYKMNSPLPLQYYFILTHYYNKYPSVLINPFWNLFASVWSKLTYQKYDRVVLAHMSPYLHTTAAAELRPLTADRARTRLPCGEGSAPRAAARNTRPGPWRLSAAHPLQWACSAPARWYEHFVSQISTLVLAQSG